MFPLRDVGLDETAIRVRQIHAKIMEADLLAANVPVRFAEIRLSLAWTMAQWHEHLPRPKHRLRQILTHDRVAADERLCLRLSRGGLDDFPGNRPWLCRAGIGLRPDQNKGDYVFRTGLAMRLFQTMIFADRPREGVRLALTTLASAAEVAKVPTIAGEA